MVDDVLTVDTLAGEVGSEATLPAVLVVDDGNVVTDPGELGRYQITAEIMGRSPFQRSTIAPPQQDRLPAADGSPSALHPR